jgi:hypothetical protein
MALGRLVPVLLLAGGATYGAQTGGKAVTRLLDTVKTVVTQFELSGIHKILTLEVAMNGPGEWATSSSAFRDRLKQEMGTPGNRDPSIDMWGKAFVLRPGSDGKHEIASLGPNGQADGCGARKTDRDVLRETEKFQERQRKRLKKAGIDPDKPITDEPITDAWWKQLPGRQPDPQPPEGATDEEEEPDEPDPDAGKPDDVCAYIDLRTNVNNAPYRRIKR